MDKKDLRAILNLLDDPDENIYNTLRDKLLEQGVDIISDLEEAWEKTSEEILQERIESIIHTIQFGDIKNKLKSWKEDSEENLLYGVFLIAKFQYPELEYDAIVQKIENIKKEVWVELNNNLTALEKIKVLNHILFKIIGYKRNVTNPNSPQNLFINDILNLKRGNQISMSVLYAIVAQELNLPVFGVNLPSTFILAYKDEYSHIQKISEEMEDDILFYINPYNKGAVFGKKEIDYFLKQQKIEPKNSYYNSCSNNKSLERIIESLIESYEKLGYRDKVDNLRILLNVLIEN